MDCDDAAFSDDGPTRPPQKYHGRSGPLEPCRTRTTLLSGPPPPSPGGGNNAERDVAGSPRAPLPLLHTRTHPRRPLVSPLPSLYTHSRTSHTYTTHPTRTRTPDTFTYTHTHAPLCAAQLFPPYTPNTYTYTPTRHISPHARAPLRGPATLDPSLTSTSRTVDQTPP